MLTRENVLVYTPHAKTAPTDSDVVTTSDMPVKRYYVNSVGTVLPYYFPGDIRFRTRGARPWIIVEVDETTLEIKETERIPAAGLLEFVQPAEFINMEDELTRDSLIKVEV